MAAGEIIIAARTYFGSLPSINRFWFNAAVNREDEQALPVWQTCLESGDSMAHFALGYTLFELGRFHEAYGHLRYYTDLAPAQPWVWCWFGKAAEAPGPDRRGMGRLRARDRTHRGGRGRDRGGQVATPARHLTVDGIDDSLACALARIDDFESVQAGVRDQDLLDAVVCLQESVGIDDEARARIGEWIQERGRASRHGTGQVLLGIVIGLMAAELHADAGHLSV